MTEPTLSTEAAIIQWAKDKGINEPTSQAMKTIEEAEELHDAVGNLQVTEEDSLEPDHWFYGTKDNVKLELGDVLITLIIQAHLQGTTVRECLELAWNKIKDRKGKTVNGQFVKEEDL